MSARAGPGERSSTGWLLAAPALAGLSAFVAAPFLAAVALSFTDLRLGSPLSLELVGLDQYERILGDPGFRRALLNNLVFAAVVVPVQTTLALALALALDRLADLGPRVAVVLRTAFFLPVVFPMSLVSVVWILIYAPGPDGPLNTFLESFSFGLWEPRDVLRDPVLALPAIMVVSIWQGVGFQMVVLLAGLQGIPRELHEAAALDGAGRWRRLVHVILPQLRQPLVFVMLATTILAFRLFEQVQIMTRGGPDDATTTVMYETVQAVFTRQQVARASAMTVVFFLGVLGVTWLQRRLVRERGQSAREPARRWRRRARGEST